MLCAVRWLIVLCVLFVVGCVLACSVFARCLLFVVCRLLVGGLVVCSLWFVGWLRSDCTFGVCCLVFGVCGFVV